MSQNLKLLANSEAWSEDGVFYLNHGQLDDFLLLSALLDIDILMSLTVTKVNYLAIKGFVNRGVTRIFPLPNINRLMLGHMRLR